MHRRLMHKGDGILFFLSQKFSINNILPTIVLMGIFLLPHGAGYRFSLGHIDAPRAVLILVTVLGLIHVLRKFFKSKKIVSLPGSFSVVLLVLIILLSAVNSSSPYASLVLASQMCVLWFVFAYSFFDLFKHNLSHNLINKSLVLISCILCAFALIELLTQQYIIHPTLRTSFLNEPSFQFFLSTISRSGSILTQGPFTWNHSLSGVCVAMAGALIYITDKFQNRVGLIFSLIYVMLLMSTGVRAGYFGVLIALFCYSIFLKKYNYLFLFIVASVAVNLFYQFYIGNSAPVFFTYDIDIKWLDETPAKMNNYKNFLVYSAECPSFMSCAEIVKSLMNLGPVGIKFLGFASNLMQLDEWWLLGYGFGSFQRPQIVLSNALQYDDPGLLQLIFLESGAIAGFLLIGILTRAIILSLRYEQMRAFSISIVSWMLFALSSWDVWPLLLIMVYVFKIFNYDHLNRISIAEKHRNPH